MSSFTPEQFQQSMHLMEPFIEKVAWRIGDKINDRMLDAMRAQIAGHVRDCKTTKRLKAIYLVAIGIALGFGLGGGGIGYAIALAKVAGAAAH